MCYFRSVYFEATWVVRAIFSVTGASARPSIIIVKQAGWLCFSNWVRKFSIRIPENVFDGFRNFYLFSPSFPSFHLLYESTDKMAAQVLTIHDSLHYPSGNDDQTGSSRALEALTKAMQILVDENAKGRGSSESNAVDASKQEAPQGITLKTIETCTTQIP